MRTAKQIEYELISALESGTDSMFWQSVQTSLVGKELIRFAVETIQQQEIIKDTLDESIDLDNASYKKLCISANWYMTFISNVQPATVVVTGMSSGFHKAYSLSYSKGKAYYSNITDVIVGADTQVTLYQGVHRYSKSSAWDKWEPSDGTASVVSVMQYPYGESSFRLLLNIGKAIPESIRVFSVSTSGTVYAIPAISPLSVGSLAYVPYNFQDGTCGIFIDSTYAKTQADFNYLIEWMEPTTYDVSSGDSNVISYSNAAETVEYARGSLLKSMYKNNSLTFNNICDFIKADQRVVDAKIYDTVLWIKPISTYLNYNFNDLASTIKLYANIGSKFTINTANLLYVNCVLYSNSTEGITLVDTSELVTTYLSHDTLGYKDTLPFVELNTGVNQLSLSEYVSCFCLKFLQSEDSVTKVIYTKGTYYNTSSTSSVITYNIPITGNWILGGMPFFFNANANIITALSNISTAHAGSTLELSYTDANKTHYVTFKGTMNKYGSVLYDTITIGTDADSSSTIGDSIYVPINFSGQLNGCYVEVE